MTVWLCETKRGNKDYQSRRAVSSIIGDSMDQVESQKRVQPARGLRIQRWEYPRGSASPVSAYSWMALHIRKNLILSQIKREVNTYLNFLKAILYSVGQMHQNGIRLKSERWQRRKYISVHMNWWWLEIIFQ